MPLIAAGILLLIFAFLALGVTVAAEFVIGAVVVALVAIAGSIYLFRTRPR